MPISRLTILGAGSLRCGPSIVGSLASYFGERPLEVRMYDADEERLDTFDRLARLCFVSTYSSHTLISTTDPVEALDQTEAVVLSVDDNCARLLIASPRPEADALPAEYSVQEAVDRLIGRLPDDVLVLSLLDDNVQLPRLTYYRSDWPGPLDSANRFRLPMQILRWLNKEDMLYELLSANEDTPLKAWLDDPRSAELMLGSR